MAVGLVAFFAFDVGIVAYALNSTRTAGESSPSAAPGAMASPSPDATPSPESTASAEIAIPELPVVSTRLLSALNESIAWRAATGLCPETVASPEITSDDGLTWTATDATGASGIRSIQSISVGGAATASLVGQSPTDCSVMLVRTFVAGEDYEEFAAGLDEVWQVNPLNRQEITSPTGTFAGPCESAFTLAPRDSLNAAVLCGDGSLALTDDAGASWTAPVATVGAVSLAASETGYLLASVADPVCLGVRIAELGADGTVVPTGCFESQLPVETLIGNVAIAEGDGAVWIWAGDAIGRSLDAGATWL